MTAKDTKERLETMRRHARQLILESSEWLTESDIAARGDRECLNLHETLNRWKAEKRIFALNIDGVDHFPAYGFEEVNKNGARKLKPKAGLHAVIRALGERYSDWDIAGWLASPNGYLLDAHRPLELLDSELKSVVKAAEITAIGIQHG